MNEMNFHMKKRRKFKTKFQCLFLNLLFQSNRTTIHKNLYICLLVIEVLFWLGIIQNETSMLCGFTTAFLHCAFLCAISWIFLEGIVLFENENFTYSILIRIDFFKKICNQILCEPTTFDNNKMHDIDIRTRGNRSMTIGRSPSRRFSVVCHIDHRRDSARGGKVLANSVLLLADVRRVADHSRHFTGNRSELVHRQWRRLRLDGTKLFVLLHFRPSMLHLCGGKYRQLVMSRMRLRSL